VGCEHKKICINTSSGGWLARKAGNIAELEVKFSGVDASEGSLRIDNQLIKLIP